MLTRDVGAERPRPFRWRLIPAAFLAVCGALMTLGGAGSIAVFTILALMQKIAAPLSVIVGHVLQGVLCMFVGAGCFIAARLFWTNRWKLALIVLAVVYVTGVAGFELTGTLQPR